MLSTLRPARIHGDCSAWPQCGREVTGACACTGAAPAPPTLPAAPVDPVPALVALAVEVRVKADRLRSGEAVLSPMDAARYRRRVAEEIDRLAEERRSP